MEAYIKLSTLEYPISKNSLEAQLRDITVQEERTSFINDHALVLESPKPEINKYQKIVEDTPVLNSDGRYVTVYKAVSIFVDHVDENGIFHTKEEQELAITKGVEEQRLNGIKNVLMREMNKRLDAFARLKGWDDIKTLAIRAGYEGPYQEEGLVGALTMDLSRKVILDIFEQSKLGKRKHPETYKDIESELPELIWQK